LSMLQKKSNPHFLHQGLKTVLYCPVCDSHYNSISTQIIEEKDNNHLIHLECTKCGSSVLALVMTGGLGVTSVGLITDLTSSDVLRFKDSDNISLDDVIEIHSLVQGGLKPFNKL